MIRTTAVVGTGLIGTSIALALTRKGVRVHLLDADESAARTAESLGAGVCRVPDGTAGCGNCGLNTPGPAAAGVRATTKELH